MKTLLLILSLFALFAFSSAELDPREVVYLHNYHRANNGVIKPNGQKLILPQLVWNEHLAQTAHWNAAGYETQRSWRLPNGDLRDSANQDGKITYCGPEKKFEKIFEKWWSGKHYYQYGSYPDIVPEGKSLIDVAPYAQLINAKTYEVGCAQYGSCTVCFYAYVGNCNGCRPYS